MSKINQLTESVAIVQEQVRNCQRHQQQLLRKGSVLEYIGLIVCIYI